MQTQFSTTCVLLIGLTCALPNSGFAKLKTAHAGSPETSRPFGLGVVLGEPTGITGKYWIDRRSAVDTTLSYSFSDYFLVFADYLYHFPGAFGQTNEFVSALNPYVGVGAEIFIQTQDTGNKDRTYFRSDQGSAGFGIRIPLGVEWRPVTVPLGVFAEIAPGVGVIPATYGFVQGGVGIRFYF
ncbi:MAG: hypothetical protein ACJ763_13815 [Bdellovibrionia bacterium]